MPCKPVSQRSQRPTNERATQSRRAARHYVDDDTLRFHKSRVDLAPRHTDGGLLFAIVTSDALNYENARRGYRYVIFDVFGTVISRCTLEDAWSKRDKCERAMWAALEAIDAKAHTVDAIAKARTSYAAEMNALRKDSGSLRKKPSRRLKARSPSQSPWRT